MTLFSNLLCRQDSAGVPALTSLVSTAVNACVTDSSWDKLLNYWQSKTLGLSIYNRTSTYCILSRFADAPRSVTTLLI
ncbi:hypothetical protein I7I50_00272 [Histoplasma capsulatum G186AR]|uniref:Uncharacterized protein n=1 Tax=Ajellomyces capsulatus TaxID=5037 RepID=A0A8H7YDR2_AJECA|nr:hypothetical protein I7I52_07540 [Histoplasma capsulatum]QSS72428.1 hypothetical protein I7I50_00272 [Histoplasma capsulatum G186AR]